MHERPETRPRRTLLRSRAASLLAILLSGCVVSKGLVVEPMGREPVEVKSPVKAHLRDGSTVVFRWGAKVDGSSVRGSGVKHDLTLASSQDVKLVPLDEIVAMERFSSEIDQAATVGLSLLAIAGLAVASAGAAVAIFGSCPTVYSGAGGAATLEAETFSHSIVPLFEGRDLDRLSTDVDATGSLRLEVRNEALETHYINHLQVLDVRHGERETVVPDSGGAPLLVGPRAVPAAAVGRTGIDLSEILAKADGEVFRTPSSVLAAAGPGDLDDWIDVSFPAPASGSAALVLRARSSLLNTVLFYDVMLGAAGPRAIDWLGGLERISDAVEFGRFGRKYMGLRVLENRDGSFHELARLPDPGPIAWHDAGVVVPVKKGASEVRLRIAFVADAWRIDSLALAASLRRATPRLLPVAEVTGTTGIVEADALRSLRAPDKQYLKTTPGQRFFARFDPKPLARGEARTLLLSSQGYYIEWVRGEWLRAERPRVFEPGEAAIVEALTRWRQKQPAMEAQFEALRVPVL